MRATKKNTAMLIFLKVNTVMFTLQMLSGFNTNCFGIQVHFLETNGNLFGRIRIVFDRTSWI